MTVFDLILYLCVAILVLFVVGGVVLLVMFTWAGWSAMRQAQAEFEKNLTTGDEKKEV